MTNTEYKAFKGMVAKADAQDTVWWAGYYWIALTKKQCRDMLDLLETKPFMRHTTTLTGKDALMMPSGLCIHY